MNLTVRQLTSVTPGVVTAINRFLPQLSRRAPAIDAQTLEKLIAREDLFLLLAYDGDQPIGMIQLAGYPRTNGPMAWVDGMVVDQAYRGMGVGLALLKEVLVIAQQKGWHEVNLTSKPERIAANHLYKKLGFEQLPKNYWRHSH